VSASLPIVPDTALPASVRNGSASDRKDYSTALAFEQVMLGQVVKAMVPEDSGLAQGPYAGAVQDAFAQGITDAGGIGLARQIFASMHGKAA
jgi:hypothetical protein